MEVGFGSGEDVVGAATALDLRLDPNPRPFSREFRELIRRDGAARDGGSTTTATTTAAQRRSGRGILLYYVWIEMGWVEGRKRWSHMGTGQHSTGFDLTRTHTLGGSSG